MTLGESRTKINEILVLLADRLIENESRWEEFHYHISRYHLDMDQLIEVVENEANKLKITTFWQLVKSKKVTFSP